MWLITTRGFFSAVQHRDDPSRLLIRARSAEDIRALKDFLPDAEPWALNDSDYEWRLECSAVEWATAVAQMALEVDYANFKSAVRKRQGRKREGIYMSVWSALRRIERKSRFTERWASKSKGKNRKAGQRTLPLSDQRCDCWWDADSGDELDHDIGCPYAAEIGATA